MPTSRNLRKPKENKHVLKINLREPTSITVTHLEIAGSIQTAGE